MNSLTVKILAALVSVLLVTTICTQVYTLLHDRHDTEEAVLATVNEDIMFDGVVVRDEKVVTYNGTGVLDFKYADGSKVSVNNTIAEVYSSEEAIQVRDRINAIDAEIELLEKSQNPGTTAYIEPETLLSSIQGSYSQMLNCIDERDYEKLASVKSALTYSTNVYNVITGKAVDYDAGISALKSERDSLKSRASAPKDVIKADKTGYFVSYADGYEDILTTDSISGLTEEKINSIIKGNVTPPANAIGKTFDSYSCKIVGVVKKDSRVSDDAKVDLMLNTSGDIYNCKVEKVQELGDGEKVMVVLSCDRLDEALVESRVLSAKLIFDKFQGIKVPRSALRFKGEQKGVYVMLGKDVSFKKVNVIYEGDDFVLSENTSDEDCLLLYDQILLEVVSNKDVQDLSGPDSRTSDE
ncbi:MAG: hypothetical protein IJ806_05275 [Ruminococcus sp.]|nr:hypothetical protein [Ruminococcus sp.]